ncbi:MAG: nucleotidyltransferase family protein [Flavobacterium sp.]
MKETTAVIILAAGNSSRLGKPKQLLPYKNTTLLKHTVSQVLLLPDSIVIVVTGSNTELIQKDLKNQKVTLCYNPDWENGMSTSIIEGLKAVLNLTPHIQKCIFAVCDQPYVTVFVFEDLISEYEKSGKGIIASAYSETVGTPVLFDKKYFNQLLELKGQEGAKKIIIRFTEDTASIPFEKGAIDIDTIEDYNNLIN